MENSTGIYLHIPFCRQKCPYCDFYSLPAREAEMDAYTAALCRAMEGPLHRGVRGSTLYLGGGTPSLLGPARLEKLLYTATEAFSLDQNAEITLEVNPGTVDEELLFTLRRLGYNRLSLGVQSLDDGELAALGRIHTAKQAVDIIEAAHRSGFASLSADVMLGVPGQTEESLSHTLDTLARLPLNHISAYILKIEPETPFALSPPRLPEEDAAADLYLDCVAFLENRGVHQYEISNFARPGGESRHNLLYWDCREYLGLGPGAHSFLGFRRSHFPRDLGAFIRAATPLDLAVDDGPGGGIMEYAMLRLRLREGLPLGEVARRQKDGAAPLLREAEHLARHGLVVVKDGAISLTPRGFLLSNAVIGALLDTLEP